MTVDRCTGGIILRITLYIECVIIDCEPVLIAGALLCVTLIRMYKGHGEATSQVDMHRSPVYNPRLYASCLLPVRVPPSTERARVGPRNRNAYLPSRRSKLYTVCRIDRCGVRGVRQCAVCGSVRCVVCRCVNLSLQ